MKFARSIITLLLLAFLLSFTAHAQVAPPLSLNSSPTSPSPGEQVLVTAAAPSFEKDSVFYDWIVDGRSRPELSGLGKNTITLTAGELGSSIRVSVDMARSGTGEGGKVSLTIPVADLSLLWTAETLVPAWYRGKTLATPGSVVNIIAIPEFLMDGQRVAPQNLVYHWTLDDQTNTLVGVGKQVFSIKTSDIPQTSHQIQVTVEDGDGRIRKQRQTFILTDIPRAVIYPYTPLGGIETRTNTSFLATDRQRGIFDFLAEAFFFPVQSRNELSFLWNVSGVPVGGAVADPGLLTINASEVPGGQQTLPISVEIGYTKSLIPLSATQALNLFLQ